MPPKRSAMVQSMRDAFAEDVSAAEVEKIAHAAIQEGESILGAVRGLRDAVQHKTYTVNEQPKQTPMDILQLLQRYQAYTRELFLSTEQIRTVITIRIPEIKEEDNLGVNVQLTVLRMLDKLEGKLVGKAGGGGGDDKEGAGAPCLAGMFAAREYLCARGGIEEKLLGKPAEDKDEKDKDKSAAAGGEKGGTKAPSAILELQQLDADTLLKLELALVHLIVTLRGFVNIYVLNWKKLIQPRVAKDNMVT